MGSDQKPIPAEKVCRQRKRGVVSCHVSQRAFSLVELVIVIVIIGIVAAIAMPRFSSASRRATARSVAKTLKVLNDAAEHYKAEHGCYPGTNNCSNPLVPPFLVSRQFLKKTNRKGGSGEGDLNFGPYILPDGYDDGEPLFPRNPYMDQSDPKEGRYIRAYRSGDLLTPGSNMGWLLDVDEGSFNIRLCDEGDADPKLSDVVKWAAPAPIIYGTYPTLSDCSGS